MSPLYYAGALLLILHGLFHFLSTAAYMKLVTTRHVPYKTTILFDRLDLGQKGIVAFGVLWGIAAIGYITAGIGIMTGATWLWSELLATALFSTTLTLLDLKAALGGLTANLVVLFFYWPGPLILYWYVAKA